MFTEYLSYVSHMTDTVSNQGTLFIIRDYQPLKPAYAVVHGEPAHTLIQARPWLVVATHSSPLMNPKPSGTEVLLTVSTSAGNVADIMNLTWNRQFLHDFLISLEVSL